jgi:hypothetical protein
MNPAQQPLLQQPQPGQYEQSLNDPPGHKHPVADVSSMQDSAMTKAGAPTSANPAYSGLGETKVILLHRHERKKPSTS